MKTILTFSAAAVALTLFATVADAAPRGSHFRAPVRDSHVHRGHDHGKVIYKRVMVGRARDGCPIYRMVAVPAPRPHAHRHGHHRGHRGHDGHRH